MTRLIQTIGCFVLVDATFVPPFNLWVSGEFSPAWLWQAGGAFFLHLFLPAILLLTTLLARPARGRLGTSPEAIEWRPRYI